MAKFIGTLEEFNEFIGPKIRNLVQYICRHEKRSREGICEDCLQKHLALESAHIQGRGRKDVILEALNKLQDSDGMVECDLKEVIEEIAKLHHPIKDHFRFLCRGCHRQYDNAQKPFSAPKIVSTQQRTKIAVLPISVEFGNIELFKEQLLAKKKAFIRINYADGRQEEKLWDARNFGVNSNLLGNVRSRPEFRKAVWKEKGIQSHYLYFPPEK